MKSVCLVLLAMYGHVGVFYLSEPLEMLISNRSSKIFAKPPPGDSKSWESLDEVDIV